MPRTTRTALALRFHDASLPLPWPAQAVRSQPSQVYRRPAYPQTSHVSADFIYICSIALSTSILARVDSAPSQRIFRTPLLCLITTSLITLRWSVLRMSLISSQTRYIRRFHPPPHSGKPRG